MSVALDACHEWQRENLELMWTLEGRDRDEMLFMAGYRRALEDAADAMETANNEAWEANRQGHTVIIPGPDWLRARAAATAPDPRETKD